MEEMRSKAQRCADMQVARQITKNEIWMPKNTRKKEAQNFGAPMLAANRVFCRVPFAVFVC